VSSSYLKAMQLTKQLEEKAKEEKKNRQLAESEMQDAEAIIKSAKSCDINVSKAEELLVKAGSNIEGKEYRDALTQATQSKEMAMKCFEDGIKSIIDSVEKMVELTKSAGTENNDGLSLLKDAKSALLEKNYERAMALSKQSWGALEKVAQGYLSETYSQAQSMIVLARNVGEDVSASEDLLDQAKKSMENQDYFSALNQLKECMDSVGSGLSSQVDGLLDEAKSYLVVAKELDINVSKVEDLIRRAESDISESNLEAALSSSRLSKSEAEKTLNRGLSETLDNLAISIQEADKIDAEIDKSNELMNIAKNILKDADYIGAIEAIKELKSEIHNTQFQKVLSTISQSRSKFIAANKIGADLSSAMEFLNKAKNSLKEGDFIAALDMAKKGDDVVDSIVSEFENIQNTIASIEEQIITAKKLGAPVINVENSIASAKESLEARDFESVQAYVKQARDEISSALYSYATECIEVAELVISAGDKLGANLKEPESLLKQSIDAAKSGNFQKSIDLSSEGTMRAEEIIKIHVSNTIASVELAMYDAENVDINLIQQLLTAAKSEFEKNAFDSAFEHADKALNMLETSQSAKARDMVSNLNKSISISKEMNCDVSSLEDSSLKCETLLKNRDFSGAFEEAEKSIAESRNLQYVAAERMFGEGKLAAIEAKKLGIDISDMKESLKVAKTAFSRADFLTTYKESFNAKTTSERQIMFHRKAYDAINQAAAILAEAKKNKIEVKEPMGILLSAKGMFERFEYENALKEAEKAKAETEKITDLHVAANKLHFTEEGISVLDTLGIEAPELKNKAQKLSEYIKSEQEKQAIIIANETETAVIDVLTKALSNLLSTTESLIMDAKELNLVVSAQEELLDKSRKELEQKHFKESVEMANMVKEQIDDIRKLSQRAAMEIKAAQDVLNDGETLHANMSESRKLLESSLNELNKSNYKGSIDFATKSANTSRKLVEAHVSETIKSFRVSIEKAKLEGVNVLASEKLMAKAVEAFNNKDYKTALSEAMKSEGELEKVGLQQDMAEKAIQTAESKINDAQKSGIFSKKAKNLISQARDEMKKGNYVRALEQAIQSGDELHLIAEDHTETLEAINTLTSQIEVARKISANVSIAEKMLADANSAKNDYDYKTATEIAKEGALEAKRLCHSHLSSLLTAAYKNTDLAGQYGIDVSSSSALLAEAKTFMDTGKFNVSHEKINQTMADTQGKLKSFFEDNYAQSERAMAHAKEVGAEITASQELLAKARKAFEDNKFKDAIALLEKSKNAIDLKKGFEREFIELTYEAEKVISNSKKFGINVKEAQNLFEQARTQKDSDYQLALSTLKKSIETVKTAVSEFRPMLVANLATDRVTKGEWVETELTLTNKGKALAKDISVNIIGDISVEGDMKIEAIRGGGGEVKLKVKIYSDTPGDVPAIIKLTSTRIMDGLSFEDEVSTHIFVMEPVVEEPRIASKSTFEIIKSPADTKCGICMGKVKTGLEIIKCSCGKEYHAMCGRRFGKCAGCGIEFTEKMDEKVQEEDFAELDVGKTQTSPPAVSEPVKPAESPKTEEPEKSAPVPEEPKKAVKKKVALKF